METETRITVNRVVRTEHFLARPTGHEMVLTRILAVHRTDTRMLRTDVRVADLARLKAPCGVVVVADRAVPGVFLTDRSLDIDH